MGANGELFLGNSIPQNPEKSTPDGDFPLENVSKEANQQASGDITGLPETAGITEPSADLIRSLNALREMAARGEKNMKSSELFDFFMFLRKTVYFRNYLWYNYSGGNWSFSSMRRINCP
jgi:hypothetical protein